MGKKIVILNGGPRLNGNTAALIREFTKGAESAGNTVARFDLDRMKIHGCKGVLAAEKIQRNPAFRKMI